MRCCSSQVALEAAPKPPQEVVDLNHYFSRLMLRELDHFRGGQPQPAADDTTITTAATEVADTAPPPATGQDPTNMAAESATARAPAPVTTPTTDGDGETRQPVPAAQQPQPQATTTTATLPAADGLQGRPLKLVPIPNKTERQRKNNGARQQRVYRLAAKFGVSPGGARWIRGGKPFAQPALPRSVVRTDGSNNTVVEYNQFMYDGEGEDNSRVMLRMPGGWKRDLVRSRPQFVGVAVIDGFLWPRFSPNLSRRMTVDWEEQGFVEFNEVTYTTPFVAREPRPAPRASDEKEDGILIRFDE